MDSVGWGRQTQHMACFPATLQPQEPHLRPSLSAPVPGWGGGRGTLLGINFTVWILLYAVYFSGRLALEPSTPTVSWVPLGLTHSCQRQSGPDRAGEPVLTLPLSPNPWGTGHLGLRKAGWECGFEPFPVFFSRGSNGHGSRSLDSRGHTAGSEPSRTQ